MMAAERTFVPSNTLTPRRWALESRPLRVEPPPLVLDMSGSPCPVRPRSARGRHRDGGDLHGGVVLTMSPPAAPTGFGLVGEATDLGSELLTHDPGRDHRSGQLLGGSQNPVG